MTRPTIGESLNPWPEKPNATCRPATPGKGPSTGFQSGVTSYTPGHDAASPASARIDAQGAHRMPILADAGVAAARAGVHAVEPDSKQASGPLPGVEGLTAPFGLLGP